MKQFNDLLGDFWRDYAALVMLGGGLLGVVLLISFGIWAKRSQKPLRPLALAFSMNLALLLNAEGMWIIAIDQLNLPKIFALLVFAVFEICFLTATSLAAEQYRNTSVYDADGKIVTPGHPGPMLYIAALIAGLSGVIVASNAVTFTEKLLRLAVPCMIFLMWWAALTAAGQRVRRGRFAYSPRRLAERWGWLIPDDDPDLVRMAADRQVRRMVINYHRVSGNRFPKAWWRSRLMKDARTAGEPVVDDVIEQLARIQRVMDLLVPGATRISVPVRTLSEVTAAVAAPAGSVADPLGRALEPAVVTGGPTDDAPAAGSAVNGSAVNGSTVNGSAVNGSAVNGSAANGSAVNGSAAGGPTVQFVQPVRFVPPVQADPTAPTPVVAAAAAGSGSPAATVADGPADPDRPSAGIVAPDSASAVPGGTARNEPTIPNGVYPVQPAPNGVQPAGYAVRSAPVRPVPPLAPSDTQLSGTQSSGAQSSGAQPGGAPVPVPVPVQRGPVDQAAPAPAATPSWATTPTGARPAVSIAGSPWWRLAVDRLSKLVAKEITAEDLPEMNYLRINELARTLAPRVQELGEGVVRTFINEYIRELDGEHVESAYPWRDFLPAPAAAQVGSEAWHAALADLRGALEEELSDAQVPLDSAELTELLAPSAPRLDDATIRGFITDYLLALSGMTAPGSTQPWAELLPRAQSARPASDDDLLEMHGAELAEHLRSTGRLSRYKVQAVTGIKSKVQADRLKSVIEERVAETATA